MQFCLATKTTQSRLAGGQCFVVFVVPPVPPVFPPHSPAHASQCVQLVGIPANRRGVSEAGTAGAQVLSRMVFAHVPL